MRVDVRDARGQSVKAAVIVFRVTIGQADGAAMTDSLAVTDASGVAEAELRLGAQPGPVEVHAFPQGAEDRGVVLTATALGGPVLNSVLPASVGPGDTLTLSGSGLGGTSALVEIGVARVAPFGGDNAQMRVVVPDCAGSGSVGVRVQSGTAWTAARTVSLSARRRPLTLRPFEATVIGAAELSSCAMITTDGGAEFILIPQLAVAAAAPSPTVVRVTSGAATLQALFGGAGAGARTAAMDAQQQLDATLRDAERRLAPYARAGTETSLETAPLALGSLRNFRVITTQAGDQFTDATGRLRYLGEHLGIYLDTAAKTSYTDFELEKLANLFDKDLYHIGLDAFGPESDIDNNGKVLVFLTPKVNALVASTDCIARGFVTGFFYGRDLLPSTPNSNRGEIFYALVPDPSGKYSCPHASPDVQRLVSSTFVHEMQHMISYFHHVVARGGEPESHWINEGLSHIAEELASRLYEVRYPPPLNRSTPTQIFPDSAGPFIGQLLMNAYLYLASSATHSVTTFDGTGSLEERGGAWLFLRWLGDQKGEGMYKRLVQTSQTGIANVEARAGEPFAKLFGDFSVALWADSLPGAPRSAMAPRYRFATRNLRQLMARQATISGWEAAWPVVTVRVPKDGYAEGSVLQGTMVFGTYGPFANGAGASVLTFAKSGGGAFAPSDGAQLGVLRVR